MYWYCKIFLINIHLFLRERDRKLMGGVEREGDRGSEAGSKLTAEGPMQGLNSQTLRS